MSLQNDSMLRLAVDLSPLSMGLPGPNGGITPYLAETLDVLGRNAPVPYQLVILGDEAVRTAFRPRLPDHAQFLDTALTPPEQTASVVDCLYCPLGHSSLLGMGLPTVSLVVDTLHRDHPEFLSPEQVQRRERRFNDMVRHADLFQCISTFAANRLVHHFEVSPDRIVFSSPVFQNARELINEPESVRGIKAPFFFYPANFGAHKNHETLLVAYRIYRERNRAQSWPLVLMGDLDERSKYLRRVASLLAISAEVHFVEGGSSDKTKQFFRSAGCMIFPSVYEGFGIPLLQAMELGVPIVAGRRAAIPEVVGSAAFYTDVRSPQALADAMGRVASDTSLREQLIRKGRERCAIGVFKQEVLRLSEAFSRAIAIKEARAA